MAKGKEFDLHVWAKPETERMSALFTISYKSGGAICIDAPLNMALRSLTEAMEDAAA